MKYVQIVFWATLTFFAVVYVVGMIVTTVDNPSTWSEPWR